MYINLINWTAEYSWLSTGQAFLDHYCHKPHLKLCQPQQLTIIALQQGMKFHHFIQSNWPYPKKGISRLERMQRATTRRVSGLNVSHMKNGSKSTLRKYFILTHTILYNLIHTGITSSSPDGIARLIILGKFIEDHAVWHARLLISGTVHSRIGFRAVCIHKL